MCFIKNKIFPSLLLKDKFVYKILIINKLDNHEYSFKTPFMLEEVVLGKSYKGKFKSNENILNVITNDHITEGFIHSYSNYNIAKLTLNNLKKYRVNLDFVIVIGKIPRFSLYFQNYDEIASRKLKYVNIVK